MKKRHPFTTGLPATLGALCIAWLTLGACQDKTLYTHEELYGSPVALSADWQGLPPTAKALTVEAVSLTKGIDHRQSFTLPATGTLQVTLPEARYLLTVTHEADQLTRDGELFRLTPTADGLLPEPEALSTVRLETKVTAQQLTPVSLPLHPLTRLLSLRFRLGASQAEEIQGMEARLEGMASAIHIDGADRSQGTSGIVAPTLQPDPTANEVTYQGTVRTLGTHPGERQTLSVIIHLADGSSFTTQTDATSLLRNLNSHLNDSPYEVAFTLYSAGRPGGALHFELQPWADAGGDEDGDAGMVLPDK